MASGWLLVPPSIQIWKGMTLELFKRCIVLFRKRQPQSIEAATGYPELCNILFSFLRCDLGWTRVFQPLERVSIIHTCTGHAPVASSSNSLRVCRALSASNLGQTYLLCIPGGVPVDIVQGCQDGPGGFCHELCIGAPFALLHWGSALRLIHEGSHSMSDASTSV